MDTPRPSKPKRHFAWLFTVAFAGIWACSSHDEVASPTPTPGATSEPQSTPCLQFDSTRCESCRCIRCVGFLGLCDAEAECEAARGCVFNSGCQDADCLRTACGIDTEAAVDLASCGTAASCECPTSGSPPVPDGPHQMQPYRTGDPGPEPGPVGQQR